jgi:ATP-dependent phosphofructokinase / diphosphate-dependent phosphofructokinase
VGERRLRRVGILTGGADCPGLNGVLRAFVKTAHALFEWQVVGIVDGFEGLLRPDGIRELDAESVRGILPTGGTILGTSNRGDPFHHKTLVDGQVRVVDRSAEALERLGRWGVDALVVVGGDGSLSIARKLHQRGVPVVGVPKTIDNDLSATDLTFGFDTAVATATDAIDKLQSTAASHHRVMILEVMGRHAGWIALEAGLAGGVEVILIPEIPFRVDRIAEHIRERDRRGRTFSLIVVAEGACPAGGEPMMLESKDPLAPKRLGGIGPWLATELGERTTREVRATILGHLQRGGTPSAFDRVLATRFGCAAAWLVERRDFGKMVAFRGGEIVTVTIEEAVGVRKTVPPHGSRVMTARHLGISFGD